MRYTQRRLILPLKYPKCRHHHIHITFITLPASYMCNFVSQTRKPDCAGPIWTMCWWILDHMKPYWTNMDKFGLLCLFGHIYFDLFIWTYLFGPVYLDLYIWTRLFGPVSLNSYIWTHLFGPVYLDQSIWTRLFGPVYLDPWIWIGLSGPVYLDTSTWTCLFGPVFSKQFSICE